MLIARQSLRVRTPIAQIARIAYIAHTSHRVSIALCVEGLRNFVETITGMEDKTYYDFSLSFKRYHGRQKGY